jgi:hypothetical protein
MSESKKSRGIQGQSESWLRRVVGRSPATAAADEIARALTGPSPKRQTEKQRQEETLAAQVGKEKSPQQGGAKPKKP